jgi:hypothetical protein
MIFEYITGEVRVPLTGQLKTSEVRNNYREVAGLTIRLDGNVLAGSDVLGAG